MRSPPGLGGRPFSLGFLSQAVELAAAPLPAHRLPGRLAHSSEGTGEPSCLPEMPDVQPEQGIYKGPNCL